MRRSSIFYNPSRMIIEISQTMQISDLDAWTSFITSFTIFHVKLIHRRYVNHGWIILFLHVIGFSSYVALEPNNFYNVLVSQCQLQVTWWISFWFRHVHFNPRWNYLFCDDILLTLRRIWQCDKWAIFTECKVNWHII